MTIYNRVLRETTRWYEMYNNVIVFYLLGLIEWRRYKEEVLIWCNVSQARDVNLNKDLN